jgi:hypothetical protein
LRRPPGDLIPGQADDPIPGGLEPRLLVGVVAAGEGGVVVASAIDLDDQAGEGEEEVDLDAGDVDVDPRLREAVFSEQRQSAVLELASSRRGPMDQRDGEEGGGAAASRLLHLTPQRLVCDQSLDLGLVHRPRERAARKHIGEVEKGAGRGGDRDALVASDVAGRQRSYRVDPDASPWLHSPRDRDVDASSPSPPNAPHRRRGSMTQRRAGTDRQNGGDEAGVVRQMAVPDRVDATVDRMEAALAHPVGDVPPREPEGPKLGGGGDPVLPPATSASARSRGVRPSSE